MSSCCMFAIISLFFQSISSFISKLFFSVLFTSQISLYFVFPHYLLKVEFSFIFVSVKKNCMILILDINPDHLYFLFSFSDTRQVAEIQCENWVVDTILQGFVFLISQIQHGVIKFHVKSPGITRIEGGSQYLQSTLSQPCKIFLFFSVPFKSSSFWGAWCLSWLSV